jgi:hypothetical protein
VSVRKLLHSIVLFLVISSASQASELTGHVVAIADGDTFTLLTVEKQQVKIRLAEVDGYRPVIDDEIFTPEYLEKFDIVITALPFDFTTKTEVTTEISLPQYSRNSWVANELPVFTGFGDRSVLLLL